LAGVCTISLPQLCVPREFSRCLEFLRLKIEEAAARVDVPDSEMTDLDATLAALPPAGRSHVRALMNAMQLEAAEKFPTMAFAAGYVLTLAEDIWENQPSIAALTGASTDSPQAI
jgi:hypothetical protein